MGNVAMCAPSIISNNEVKIICSDGRLLVYTRAPIKAAEIMLEFPGQFLCESSHLKVGQRIPGICAEEELESGQLYFLLPMELLYSVLTNEELKFFTNKTTKGMKHAATLNFSKIFPEFCLFPNGSEAKAVDESDEIDGSNSLQKRYSRQRSWQPALETIVETPPRT
ncbi:hypothetical protein C2S52_020830 [Perilla frutescens var. hirtella]|uniref:Uncharacterized protein n=1 Tax=Perilla frutescens var. hirtella TaxID=608512 RepID=A0AAD4IXL1_PERFH|nr:hypothetical protein C2S52_020830 [Perilla frutescens var. hirtella]KAH6822918.1 hypothetical protein C2S53_020053 [Perilla frutescens var. hirtella]